MRAAAMVIARRRAGRRRLCTAGSGAVALVDLRTYAVTTVPLASEATRVRIAPDGRTALALSDRTKVAWVLR
jgi:hypothetical protein